ncbi:hypothetical protein SARC_12553, partial [Sphaeroforma arctica JP610]
EFEVSDTTVLFKVAKDLGTVFMVLPDNIKQIATETSVSRLERSTLISFLECRSDWRQCKNSVLASLNVR